MRVAKAQDEYYNSSEESSENLITFLQNKYDIPREVFLFSCDGDSRASLIESKKHISAFVKGELNDLTFSDLYFYFEEISECDYSWILIEKPAGFYGAGGSKCLIDDILPELKSIGCRSKKKNKNLPKICGILSAQ